MPGNRESGRAILAGLLGSARRADAGGRGSRVPQSCRPVISLPGYCSSPGSAGFRITGLGEDHEIGPAPFSTIRGRRVEKEYWAIVEDTEAKAQPERGSTGPIARSPVAGTWIDWLTSAGVSGVVRAVSAGTERARQAVTRFGLENASSLPPGCRWLRLWPETGRTHQLRVQAALRGLPIVGDANYGASKPFPRGIALHARRLGLRHPTLGTPLELIAPLPATWTDHGFILMDTQNTTGSPKSQAGGLFDTSIAWKVPWRS